jgi:hypothetical protein
VRRSFLLLVMASRMRPCACDTAARLCVRAVLCSSAFLLVPPLPPLAPPRRAPPCSRTSSVLSVSLTAPSRSSSATTSGLPVAAPRTASQGGDGANCHGQSVSALAQQYGGLNAAAAALGYSNVQALQEAIMRSRPRADLRRGY